MSFSLRSRAARPLAFARSFASSPRRHVRQPDEWSYPSKEGDNKPRRPFLNPDVSDQIPNKVAIRAGLPPYRLPSTNIDIYELPPTLPRTHYILTHSITFTAYDHESLRPYAAMTRHCALALLIPVTGPVHHPKTVQRWASVRSPFVHAKSKEVFERHTHSMTIDLWDTHDKNAEVLIKVLLASGRGEHVSVKVEKYSRDKFDVNADVTTPTSPLLQNTSSSKNVIQSYVDRFIAEEHARATAEPEESEVVERRSGPRGEVEWEWEANPAETETTEVVSEEEVKDQALEDAEGTGSGVGEEIERKKDELKEAGVEIEAKSE